VLSVTILYSKGTDEGPCGASDFTGYEIRNTNRILSTDQKAVEPADNQRNIKIAMLTK
jgi:hypothetical protein